MFTAIVVFAVVQFLGLGFDATWHGVLRPDFEATTTREMVAHLVTVHLPLYAGVLGFFLAIAATLGAEIRRGTAGAALWLATAGATLQIVGEGWHAWSHLRLAPEAVVPGSLSYLGFMIALVSLGMAWRRRRRVEHTVERTRRRAA